MSTAEKWHFVSVEDYLAEEERSPTKREYRAGVVYAMAEAKNSHNRIATNALGQLYSQLRGRPRQPCNSDTKIRIRLLDGTRFYYPDAFVVCQPNPPDDVFHDAPVVVLEVASASTRRIDLGEKRDAYLSIPSLAVYLVAEVKEPFVRIFRRSPFGDFRNEAAEGLDAVIDLYEGASFEDETTDRFVSEEDAD